jgi:hypothetical protein
MTLALAKTDGRLPAGSLEVDEDLLPLEVGTIAVDAASGRLTRAPSRATLAFGFSYAENAFEGTVQDIDGAVAVTIVTVIARLPYSVEDRKRRSDLLRVLSALTLSGTPLYGEVSRDQIIRVGLRMRVTPPATATRIVAEVLANLMPVRGYLDLLVELGRKPRPKPLLPAPEAVAATL